MLQYMVKRILMVLPIIIGVTVIVFALMHVTGDPIALMFGSGVSSEMVAQRRTELGLDRPLPQQYLSWLLGVLRGDMGRSIRTGDSVANMIKTRIGATLELTIIALFITIAVSIPTGIISAVKKYTVFDHLSRFFAMFWVSMPMFWLGLILILIFGVFFQWLPVSGRHGPIWTSAGFLSFIMPSLTLGLPPAALFMRLIRSSMIDVFNEDYIRTAKSKGLSENVVIYKHALRNAILPVVTLLGMRIPWLFGGSVITETVFSWPGMGRLLVDAILKRDYPIVQGIVFIIAILVILFNLGVDILYAYIDPRIRYD